MDTRSSWGHEGPSQGILPGGCSGVAPALGSLLCPDHPSDGSAGATLAQSLAGLTTDHCS